MAEQDNPANRLSEVLQILEVIPAEQIPEPDADGQYSEDEAWSADRDDAAEGLPPPPLPLEAGRLVVIMTLADLAADDLQGAYAELNTGSYQQAVYNQGADVIVLVGAAATDKLLWADFHLGEAGLQGVAFIGLSRNVARIREEAADSGQIVLTNGPLLSTVLEPGEVVIGSQLIVDET